MTVSQDRTSVLDDVLFEASQPAPEEQSLSLDSEGLLIKLLEIISATARLSYWETTLLTERCMQLAETWTGRHGTWVSLPDFMQEVESAQFLCNFDTANTSEGDTRQFSSVKCSYRYNQNQS